MLGFVGSLVIVLTYIYSHCSQLVKCDYSSTVLTTNVLFLFTLRGVAYHDRGGGVTYR